VGIKIPEIKKILNWVGFPIIPGFWVYSFLDVSLWFQGFRYSLEDHNDSIIYPCLLWTIKTLKILVTFCSNDEFIPGPNIPVIKASFFGSFVKMTKQSPSIFLSPSCCSLQVSAHSDAHTM
jgi:hypothetical protein